MLDEKLRDRDTLGSERYLRICKRLTILPEPRLVRTLRDPLGHSGSYSTQDAEVSLDATACRGLVGALEHAKGLHTIKLVGLRHGETPLLTCESLVALVHVVRSTRIEVLDLSDNALDDTLAAEQLVGLLSQKGRLASLSLAGNELGEVFGARFFKALEHNSALRHLDISSNSGLARWNTATRELERLMKINGTLVGIGASFPPAVTGSLLRLLVGQPGRMLILSLTHCALPQLAAEQLSTLLSSRQVRPPSSPPARLRFALLSPFSADAVADHLLPPQTMSHRRCAPRARRC